MKILHVFDFFSPHGGGTVDVVYKLSRALAKRRHEVTIYTSDFKLDREYINSLPEVNVRPFHCISSLAGFYLIPGMVMETKRHLREFDVIHLHSARSFQNIVIHHYAKKYGIPYVLDTHGSLPRTVTGGEEFKPMLKRQFDIAFGNRILRDASKVIAENRFGIKEHEDFGVSRANIVLIPLFLSIEEFAHLPPPGQFRERYRIGDKKVIMFLGRINYIKGLDFLAESFCELVKSRDDVILVIVGSDDGYRNTLDNRIKEMDLSDRVLFTGFLSGQDKLAALIDADVMVQPSRYEQAAWAPLEAVLCGTPIIVSKYTGAGEDVGQMDAGYLVEFGNKEEMINTVVRILGNPSEARGKAQRARDYIRENLSMSKYISSYEQMYRSVSGQTSNK